MTAAMGAGWFGGLVAGTAVLCALLAVAWLRFGGVLLSLMGAGTPMATGVVARRNAALFLGFAVLLWRAPLQDPQVRAAVGLGFGTACAGLALLGLYEFRRGRVGHGIWLAAAVEALLAIGFIAGGLAA